ncbi:MAG: DUF4097 family beta strand repeat protein [Candidatus Latescibacterota bacterium]|nr:MAG: DUF4097 family beta strand repeat protein [Candidatus Latescibacterota bacterium]
MKLRHLFEWRVLAIALAVLSTVIVTPGGGTPGGRGSKFENRLKQKVFDQTYSLEAGGELYIDVVDMDIHIRTGPDRTGSVQVFVAGSDPERAAEKFEELRFDARLESNKLSIESQGPTFVVRGFWNRNRSVRVWMIVSVPKEIDSDIRTEDGDVRIDDLTGNARVRTEDGDLEFSEIHGTSIEIHTEDGDVMADVLEADDITVSTEDGDLQIDSIKGGRVDVSSSDGDIEVSRIEAENILMETSDGDIEMTVSGNSLDAECSDGDMTITILDEMEVDVRTADGDVELNIPQNINADLDLEGGHVSVRSKISIKGRVSKERIKGSVNDGGPLIRVRTDDGSILVREG